MGTVLVWHDETRPLQAAALLLEVARRLPSAPVCAPQCTMRAFCGVPVFALKASGMSGCPRRACPCTPVQVELPAARLSSYSKSK